MSRTVRDRRALFDEPYDRMDRDHHCRVLGCYGQSQKDRKRRGETPMKPSDRRRAAAAG